MYLTEIDDHNQKYEGFLDKYEALRRANQMKLDEMSETIKKMEDTCNEKLKKMKAEHEHEKVLLTKVKDFEIDGLKTRITELENENVDLQDELTKTQQDLRNIDVLQHQSFLSFGSDNTF